LELFQTMHLKDKVVVVTGGASGIGRALCIRFKSEGAKAIVVADVQSGAAAQVAREIDGISIETNVARESDIQRLVQQTAEKVGAIDLFCSNAGVGEGGVNASDSDWQRSWDINVMAHIYAARAVLPAMLARAEGYLLQTVSAAGLLTQVGSAPYSVTKHAAQAFAEWLSITYGDRGIRVSTLCPQGVFTPMLEAADSPFLLQNAVTPEFVADCVVKALAEERFLILPHPEVARYYQNRATDTSRWLQGMRRLQASVQTTKRK
jgi:NAD(P)-dependent dehydrogenase (short-subunit alcohol dehydrogenase family)